MTPGIPPGIPSEHHRKSRCVTRGIPADGLHGDRQSGIAALPKIQAFSATLKLDRAEGLRVRHHSHGPPLGGCTDKCVRTLHQPRSPVSDGDADLRGSGEVRYARLAPYALWRETIVLCFQGWMLAEWIREDAG
mmetsp:Transcript_33432/g.75627  ORF Transcript_33432/g.75627 Transcript_33432/m.75627 type:complete len:134 (+) Transcript_33432:134-535(+)